MYKRLAPHPKALAWQTWSGRRVVWSMSSDEHARGPACASSGWASATLAASPAFRFPFGPVRYTATGAMLSLYREIFLGRGYEVAGLGDAPVILDCGGNIGLSVIWFKQRYPRARITVFEADPQTADLLDENVRVLGLTSVTWFAPPSAMPLARYRLCLRDRWAAMSATGQGCRWTRCV